MKKGFLYRSCVRVTYKVNGFRTKTRYVVCMECVPVLNSSYIIMRRLVRSFVLLLLLPGGPDSSSVYIFIRTQLRNEEDP